MFQGEGELKIFKETNNLRNLVLFFLTLKMCLQLKPL